MSPTLKPNIEYTLSFIDIKGNAGQVKNEWRWIVGSGIRPEREFDGPAHDRLYSLERVWVGASHRWELVAHPGLVWDYASGWFDYDAMKESSLPHDIYHWLIHWGCIAESYNDAIDEEFYQSLVWCGVPRWRAKWLRRGVNTLDEKSTGTDPQHVVYLNRGKRVFVA